MFTLSSHSVFLSHKDPVDTYLRYTFSDLGVGPNSQYVNWIIILSAVKWCYMDQHLDKTLQRSLRTVISDGLLSALCNETELAESLKLG